MSSYTMDQIKVKPVREIKMSKSGVLLSAGEARYDSLDAYVFQMGSPMSILRGEGLYSFADPCAPELTLLVQCEDVDWCGRCDKSLEDCHCSF